MTQNEILGLLKCNKKHEKKIQEKSNILIPISLFFAYSIQRTTNRATAPAGMFPGSRARPSPTLGRCQTAGHGNLQPVGHPDVMSWQPLRGVPHGSTIVWVPFFSKNSGLSVSSSMTSSIFGTRAEYSVCMATRAIRD